MSSPVTKFLDHYKMTLTTLSPIHIGCDEDYNPTNYVIDDGLLYGFDSGELANMLSPENHKKLLNIVSSDNALLGVQKFVYSLRNDVPAIASHTISICADLEKKYNARIGNVVQKSTRPGNEKTIINDMAIPRTAYDQYTKKPILLGTSIKGAIRTAILNDLNQGVFQRLRPKQSKELEKDLLGGSFSKDPMRLVKVSDAMSSQSEEILDNKVLWDSNIKKQMRKDGKEPKGMSNMLEVVSEMNPRSFHGELAIHQIGQLKNHKDTPDRDISFNEIVDACNRFYGDLLQNELRILESLNCIDRKWLKTLDKIQASIEKLADSRKAMLLRVGRHSGAEGVTIEGVRQIKIMLGKGVKPKYLDHATTLWLASEQAKSQTGLIPFGWLLIEFDPDSDNKTSQDIANVLKEYHQTTLQVQAERQDVLKEKKQLLRKAKYIRQEEEAKLEEIRLAEQQKEAERLAKKALMSTEQLLTDEILELYDNPAAKNTGAGGTFAKEVKEVTAQAVNWSKEDKEALIDTLFKVLPYLGIDRKKSKAWKSCIKSLKD
jgi:CRISPR-associated protein Csm5